MKSKDKVQWTFPLIIQGSFPVSSEISLYILQMGIMNIHYSEFSINLVIS